MIDTYFCVVLYACSLERSVYKPFTAYGKRIDAYHLGHFNTSMQLSPLVYNLSNERKSETSTIKRFSIKHLERFSGIKAHTIRIWEQRYGILEPQRTKSNIRHYSLADVELLLDISVLIKHGAKISDLAGRSNVALSHRINGLIEDQAQRCKAINRLIVCMYSGDIEQFEDILDNCIRTWDVDRTIQQIILPFLDRVQLLSYSDNSCETHFAVAAVRRKIIFGLERVVPETVVNKYALLFLGEDEHYDLVLLYLSYMLKKNGIKVLYLGTNISNDNVELISHAKRPDYLFTYTPKRQKFTMHSLVPFLQKNLPEATLFVVGCEKNLTANTVSDNVKFIHYQEVDAYLKK